MKISTCKDQTLSLEGSPLPRSIPSTLNLQTMDNKPAPPGIASRSHGRSTPETLFGICSSPQQVDRTKPVRLQADPLLSRMITVPPVAQDSSSLMSSERHNICTPRRRQTSSYEHVPLTKLELLLDNGATLTALVEQMNRLDHCEGTDDASECSETLANSSCSSFCGDLDRIHDMVCTLRHSSQIWLDRSEISVDSFVSVNSDFSVSLRSKACAITA